MSVSADNPYGNLDFVPPRPLSPQRRDAIEARSAFYGTMPAPVTEGMISDTFEAQMKRHGFPVCGTIPATVSEVAHG